MEPQEFLAKATQAASESGHVWPEYAACEAALESGWGGSQLAVKANNLFGEKNPRGSTYPTLDIPTHEWDATKKVYYNTVATWPIFPDWRTAFIERMNVLRRLESAFPHYANALAAKDGETFVKEVSQTWSTDPKRADKVLAIYEKHFAKDPGVAQGASL